MRLNSRWNYCRWSYEGVRMQIKDLHYDFFFRLSQSCTDGVVNEWYKPFSILKFSVAIRPREHKQTKENEWLSLFISFIFYL